MLTYNLISILNISMTNAILYWCIDMVVNISIYFILGAILGKLYKIPGICVQIFFYSLLKWCSPYGSSRFLILLL